jgi:type II secretory pathway component GspD/PulD (secretin)
MNRRILVYRIATSVVVAALTFAWTCGWLQAAEEQSPSLTPAPMTVSPNVPAEDSASVKPKEDAPQLRIYKLQYADPQTVLSVLQRTITSGDKVSKASADLQSRSVIVMATREIHEHVIELLRGLDVPFAQKESAAQVKVFSLKYADPGQAARAISTIVPEGARFAVDDRTRSIIATGLPEALKVAEALLFKLDREAAEEHTQPSTSYEMQIAWLVDDDKAIPPADDLKDVVAELSRLGIKARQIGKMSVQTSEGNFHITSSPTFQEKTADFTASGTLTKQHDGNLSLQIAIKTERGFPGQPQGLNEFETQIIVPQQKQYVVLATAPVGNITSVFVVQVTAAPKHEESQKNR